MLHPRQLQSVAGTIMTQTGIAADHIHATAHLIEIHYWPFLFAGPTLALTDHQRHQRG